ncbi:3086_t:CDS:2, partial [Entrophospora sp. SA101]
QIQEHEQQVQVIQEQTKDDVEINDSIEAINENENNKNNGDNEEIIGENIIVEENLDMEEDAGDQKTGFLNQNRSLINRIDGIGILKGQTSNI